VKTRVVYTLYLVFVMAGLGYCILLGALHR
jgi:hypothetical protein